MAFWGTSVTTGATAGRIITWDKLYGASGPGGGLGASFLKYYNASSYSTQKKNVLFSQIGCTNLKGVICNKYIKLDNVGDSYNEWYIDEYTTQSFNDPAYEVYGCSGFGEDNARKFMIIKFRGFSTFDIYIRSWAEPQGDYVIVGNLDTDISSATSYSSTGVRTSTYGSNNTAGEGRSNYGYVSYSVSNPNLEHYIMVGYIKNSSVSLYDDYGYVAIPSRINSTMDGEAEASYKAVKWENIYIGTKKNIRVMVTNKRGSNIAITPNSMTFFVYNSSTGSTLKTYTAHSGSSSNSVSQNSSMTRYISLDWNADWYKDPNVKIGSYLGKWSVSFNGYCGLGTPGGVLASSSMGSEKEYTYKSSITYKQFWDAYSMLYWAVGDNGSSYKPSAYTTPYFSGYMNYLGATMSI